MKKIGKQTFNIKDNVFVRDTFTIVGKKEGEGPLGDKFDMIVDDDLWGEDSWEKCELKFQKEAVKHLMDKNNLEQNDIDLLISGDLLNQITSSSFAARDLMLPYIGVYGACSTMALTLGLGSLIIDGGFANNIICVTSSHFCSAERQYRMPLEMGGQRHMSAQWTVTGSAAVWLSSGGSGPKIKNVTFGKIQDLGVKDANNMGAAMAPAAYDSLSQHLEDTGIDYDLIVTGDLGTVGKSIVNKMFNEDKKSIQKKYDDCGTIIYDIEKQDVHAGGSGCGCSATVFGAFLYKKLLNQEINKLLFTSTGALHSPTATLQGESIPGIAHCVGIEMWGDSMNYIMSFVVGGIICVLGQIIIDTFKKNNAYLLVLLVVLGTFLGYFGIYDKVIEIGYSGATVPLLGFGHSLAEGAVEEAASKGFMGALSGGVIKTAPGVAAALLFGYIAAVLFNPKGK